MALMNLSHQHWGWKVCIFIDNVFLMEWRCQVLFLVKCCKGIFLEGFFMMWMVCISEGAPYFV